MGIVVNSEIHNGVVEVRRDGLVFNLASEATKSEFKEELHSLLLGV